LSGNFPLLIDLFTSFVIGFTITGLAIFIIFTDTPSKPVALFTLILLICSHVVPLHKKNSQLEAGNYKPVSILQ
jgi:uncharacterized protein YybS (DUF2232 family)